jgi:hypothetical protein
MPGQDPVSQYSDGVTGKHSRQVAKLVIDEEKRRKSGEQPACGAREGKGMGTKARLEVGNEGG